MEIENITYLKYGINPVVIWGVKTAAKICCRLMQKMNINIAAVGDNNPQNFGTELYGIRVLPLEEIKRQYPTAVIIVGSFFPNVTDNIIDKLKQAGSSFTYIRFEEIEYTYELLFSKRKVVDAEKLYNIINNISYDDDCYWKAKINGEVMLEYSYVINDYTNHDLIEALSKIYGIKNLILVAGEGRLRETVALIERLKEYDNIGHIIAILDYKKDISEDSICCLSDKVFYIICDETVSRDFVRRVESRGLIIDKRKLPDELFYSISTTSENTVTEKDIVKSVLSYVDNTHMNNIGQMKLSSKPVYIVQLFNGLANQMLMYLFGRFIEEETGRNVVFDDTILSLDIVNEEENVNRICKWLKDSDREEVSRGTLITKEKNSFYKFDRAEIAEVFDIPIRLLSDYFDSKIWNSYLMKIRQEHTYQYAQSFPLCAVLTKYGFNISAICDDLLPNEFWALKKKYRINVYTWGRPYRQNSVTAFILSQNNAYFAGGWATGQAEDWMFQHRQWVRDKVTFKAALDEENKKYEAEIRDSYSITVHIRRGDFAYFKLAASTEYYRKIMGQIERIDDPKPKRYFIFSDDLEWCEMHKRDLGLNKLEDRVTYIYGNDGERSFMDLYLMSLGKIIVPTPKSTFSYLAVLISNNVEKCVCVPKYIYDLNHKEEAEPILMDIM